MPHDDDVWGLSTDRLELGAFDLECGGRRER
jgi:hypothetical protein